LKQKLFGKEKKMKTIKMLAIIVLIWLLWLCPLVLAGNLNPPGAPEATMKTLDEVEPRTPIQSLPGDITHKYIISQPGSYYLTGDINTIIDIYGIQINAGNVTIDLCGFTISGAKPGSASGIYMIDRKNIEIRNGTIRDFGRYGIFESQNTSASHHRVINVRAIDNGQGGIFLYGKGNLIKDCTVSDNGTSASGIPSYGIYTSSAAIVTGNTCYNNGASASGGLYVYGIIVGSGSTVIDNTVYDNGNNANVSYIYGISAASGSVVTSNTARNGNSTQSSHIYGIHAQSGCTVTNNAAFMNGAPGYTTAYGIYLDGNNLVSNNTAYLNYGTNMDTTLADCAYGTNHAP
jgi:parallel beta-helix repeat protein